MRGLFWAASIPGLATILVVALGARETRSDAAKKISSEKSNASSAPLPFSFYYVVTAVTLFSLGNSSDMFLVLRAQSAGIPAAHAPLLGLAFNTVYTLVAWPAGKFSDRVSKPLVAASGYIVFAAVYLTFAIAPTRAALWLAMSSYGLYYSLTDPVLRALVTQTIAPGSRGRALGVFFFVTSIATLAASLITGELWKHFGPELPLAISAALALVAALMLVTAPRPKRSS
jgi:MFS family permease